MMDDPQACPYSITPMAEAFPPPSRKEHEGLVVRISRHDYRPPVIVWREEVVFGVHLLAAYAEAGVEPQFETVPDELDPSESIAAEATPSLGMNTNAKAVVAALASEWSTPGRPREDENSANLQNKRRADMAERYAVSVRLVNYAAQVLSEDGPAVPALRQAVRDWKVNATDAATILTLPPEVQEKSVELVIGKEVRTVKGAAERIEREGAEAAEAEALAEILALPLDETVTLHTATVGDMIQVIPQGSLDVIVAQPSHQEQDLYLLSDLASFAAHGLKDTGVMLVVASGVLLPQMLTHLEHEVLRWVLEIDQHLEGPPVGSGPPHHFHLHRRPVLVYGKTGFRHGDLHDLITVPLPEGPHAAARQREDAIRMVLELFCRPGQVVCDPIMLDRAAPALAARTLGCSFIGAAKDESCRDRIHLRLATAEDHRNDPEDGVGTEGQ